MSPKAAAHAAVNAVQALRNLALVKRPGISEAVEWATAADLLQAQGASLNDALRRSIGVALKEEDDLALVRDDLSGLISAAVCGDDRRRFRKLRAAFLEFPRKSCARIALPLPATRHSPSWPRRPCSRP